MVDADLVAAKLAALNDRVDRVRAHRTDSDDELAADRDKLDIVSFNLMLAVQACADIASHVIADEGWTAAKTLADGFQRLADQGVLEQDTAETMKKAVGLRNVVAHGYVRVDVPMVHRAATDGLDGISAFSRQVARWLERVRPTAQ
jgi:uncharacterized protein YutE (UPF0331/DUF86 family)